MTEANAWLAGYMADYNQRFAVVAKDLQDAHLPYRDTADELSGILSVHVTKKPSKNLSFQHEWQLINVKTTGSGLALRGASVTLRQHFDGTMDLLWRTQKIAFTVMIKAQKQGVEADSKTVNERVDSALTKRTVTRNTEHKPAANHPWRNRPIGKPATDGKALHSNEAKQEKGTFLFSVDNHKLALVFATHVRQAASSNVAHYTLRSDQAAIYLFLHFFAD